MSLFVKRTSLTYHNLFSQLNLRPQKRWWWNFVLTFLAFSFSPIKSPHSTIGWIFFAFWVKIIPGTLSPGRQRWSETYFCGFDEFRRWEERGGGTGPEQKMTFSWQITAVTQSELPHPPSLPRYIRATLVLVWVTQDAAWSPGEYNLATFNKKRLCYFWKAFSPECKGNIKTRFYVESNYI